MAKVTREANGIWCTRISFGRDPVTGKQLRKYKSFPEAKSEGEAQRLADEWERGFKGNGELHVADMMCEAFATYIVYLKGKNRGRRTVKTYSDDFRRYVSPKLGRMSPSEVRPYHIDSLYTFLATKGGRLGKGISPTTINKVHGMLKGFFKWAKKYGLCLDNPMLSVDPPVADEYNAVFFTEAQFRQISEQLRTISQAADGAMFARSAAMAARLAQMTGVRVGEACAIAREDIFLDRRLLVVRANVIEVGGRPVRVMKTKGKKSRVISLDAAFCAEIAAFIAWQDLRLDLEALRASQRLTLCMNEYGCVLSPSSVSRWFSRLRDAMQLPDDATFHSLRHTHASILLANGTDIRTISERLGHANESLTLKIYAHVMPGRDQAAAETIAAVDKKMAEEPEADP